jgi:hypothetical protein
MTKKVDEEETFLIFYDQLEYSKVIWHNVCPVGNFVAIYV